MDDHPALKFKYQMVYQTRGNGVETGGGQLYPHFKAPFEGMKDLDFVLDCTGDSIPYIQCIKDGGYLVSVWDDQLRIQVKRSDVLYDVPEFEAQGKSAVVLRFGGFGDSLQAANILPELKRQGYRVYFMTTPRGQEILRHDPHVDEFLIQDDDQVPNQELPHHWLYMASKFDKFVNLCESVEGALLAFPGRANHFWPASVRDDVMGKNYLEWTAQLAEVPYYSEAKFYPSLEEVNKATGYLANIKNTLAGPLTIPQRAPDRFNILWCLAGSSMHKFYPHQDTVIQRVLKEIPEAIVIFSGDYACKLLEEGWEKEPRVKCESGEMGIRDTLTLAQQVDCVVGPETGVLNAVAFEPVPKVIMLSHSTVENLTKHWVNTYSLVAPIDESVGCKNKACHRLHYGKEFCFEDKETGAASCQMAITPEMAFEAIETAYLDWKALKEWRAAA